MRIAPSHGASHLTMQGWSGQRAAVAGLHAVGGFVGQGVPHRRRVLVHPADHDLIAGPVIQPLHPGQGVAVPLHDASALGLKALTQRIDGLPVAAVGWCR